ncbi:MAG: antibiotic biosynthesis monooxygenase [Pseudomonadota bacterium]|nr:antibiotic biosynthesis monooxygenase [Pseudomonadota bacterium]
MRANTDFTTVAITCQIQPGKAELARQEFSDIIKTVMTNEAACHGIDLHLDPENPDRLLLIEYWDSKDAFTGPHMQTPHMQAFLQRAQGFLAGTPDFGYWRLLGAAP